MKPYEVGDRVDVDNDRYYVHTISLLTTTFRSKPALAAMAVLLLLGFTVCYRTPSNKLVTLANYMLPLRALTNYTRRSPFKSCDFATAVHPSNLVLVATPSSSLHVLWDHLLRWKR